MGKRTDDLQRAQTLDKRGKLEKSDEKEKDKHECESPPPPFLLYFSSPLQSTNERNTEVQGGGEKKITQLIKQI